MFAFSCKVNTIPVQAGAEALQWATSIAVKYNLVNVVIESDYRTCIQGLLPLVLLFLGILLIFC